MHWLIKSIGMNRKSCMYAGPVGIHTLPVREAVGWWGGDAGFASEATLTLIGIMSFTELSTSWRGSLWQILCFLWKLIFLKYDVAGRQDLYPGEGWAQPHRGGFPSTPDRPCTARLGALSLLAAKQARTHSDFCHRASPTRLASRLA